MGEQEGEKVERGRKRACESEEETKVIIMCEKKVESCWGGREGDREAQAEQSGV